MTRLIDADELLKHSNDHDMISTHLIFNAPTAWPRPGEWIRARCSECGHLDVEEPDFCSRCGASMKGEKV